MTYIFKCDSICGMSKKKIKIIAYLISITIGMFSLAGCGMIPELSLTEDEQELIAEYSAGLLMEYNKGHSNGLMRVSDVKYEDLNVVVTPTPIPDAIVPSVDEEIADSLPQGPDEDISGESPSVDSESVEINLTPMNEAFGLSGADLVASYIELVDTYPATGDELLLAMNAVEGKELLILHFDVSNPGAEDLNLTTNIGDHKIRALVNDEEKLRCEITLLSNDLLNYSAVLSPGEKSDEVLVFEKDKDLDISSLTLILLNSEEQLKYNLY